MPSSSIWNVDQAALRVEEDIEEDTSSTFASCFVHASSGAILSLELLINTYAASLVNELSALALLCPFDPVTNRGGFHYTFDSPSIFARQLDATLLNRLMIKGLRVALAHPANIHHKALTALRGFAFNSYADEDAVRLLELVLRERLPHVIVGHRATLFGRPNGELDVDQLAPGASLVVHNNSDAFGQNIVSLVLFVVCDPAVSGFLTSGTEGF